MPRQLWECKDCRRNYSKKVNALACEKQHREAMKAAKVQHKVKGCGVEVTWVLFCWKCKKEFTLVGNYGRSGVEPLVYEDENTTTFQCTKCLAIGEVDYREVEGVMY